MEKTTTFRKSTERCGIKYTAKVPSEAIAFFFNHFSSILASGVKVVFPIRGNPSKDLNFPQSNLHKLYFLAKYIEII